MAMNDTKQNLPISNTLSQTPVLSSKIPDLQLHVGICECDSGK